MNLTQLSDQELIVQTKRLVEKEREVLTQVLRHLREIEQRKLFCDFKCGSLFDYCVKELGYSEGQAVRRIQAMRLMRELPELQEKISTGKLSLSNIAQAQSFFREASKKPSCVLEPAAEQKPLSREEKLKVLESLEHRSAREGQKILLENGPQRPLPKERERVITQEHTQVQFVMNTNLKKQLETVRALLGPRGAVMNLTELIATMAELSVCELKAKRFGKKRSALPEDASDIGNASIPSTSEATRNVRYVSRKLRHAVWIRDRGKCVKCGSKSNIQYDHIHPVALGGTSTVQNVQLLCFHCNQRRAIKTFGFNFPKRCKPIPHQVRDGRLHLYSSDSMRGKMGSNGVVALKWSAFRI